MSTTEDVPRQGRTFLADPTMEHRRVENGSERPHSDDWQGRVWRDLARRPGRSIVVGLVAGVVLAVVTGMLVLRGPTTYSSQAAILLDDPYSIATAADEGQIIKLSDLRFKYASLAGTEVIAGPVAAQLHVPIGVVQGATSVQAPQNSLLLYVTARWNTPGFARQLATSVSDEIGAYIQSEETTYNVPQADRFRAVVVSSATPSGASRPSTSHAALVAFGAFVGIAVVAFVLSQLVWEPRRKRLA